MSTAPTPQPNGNGTKGVVLAKATMNAAVLQIEALLIALHQGQQALGDITHERLGRTKDKLAQVSTTTEGAATNILDGLDRAVALLDHADSQSPSEELQALHGQLRDELFAMMGEMQFQDIISQQLMHTNTMLADLEDQLVRLRSAMEAAQRGQMLFEEIKIDQAGAFDPAATMADAESRQSLVDSIFR